MPDLRKCDDITEHPTASTATASLPSLSSTSSNNIVLTCSICCRDFRGEYRSTLLTRHLRTHTGERPHPCKYCRYKAGTSYNLMRHVRTKHPDVVHILRD